MTIKKPLKHLVVTQPFGVNYIRKGFYEKLGIPGDAHNGMDFRLPSSLKVYSVADGTVLYSKFSKTGGNIVKIRSMVDGRIFDCRYVHLERRMVRKDQKIKAGDLIGLGGNTGSATTGPHLHFDMKFIDANNQVIDYDNGYHGMVDPAEFFPKDWNKKPIDLKYGKKQNWLIEFAIRFANIPKWIFITPFLKEQVGKGRWIHRQLIAMGRKPSSLTVNEMNAMVYGSWGFNEALDPAMYPLTAYLTKAQFKRGGEPPIRLSMG